MAKRIKQHRRYLAVDVGGTKILAALVDESGAILSRQRSSTPREGGPERVLAEIERTMVGVVEEEGIDMDDVEAIGLAVPGVVDPPHGQVVVTPNMQLSGVAIGPHLESRYGRPVALGNDCNLGALGEAWLGSARRAKSMIAILVGTGIGSGIVRNGKLWRGARESAGEIGHIVMQMGGPKCGCGNHGCLEALASRSAIERDLREGVAAGRTTVLTELLAGDLTLIRSSLLRQALEKNDPLVTEVMRRASETLGYACLTVRHLLDPEVIVLGGGVVEACSRFILPIVERIVASDQLPGARPGGHVLLSALGDDAVVLGGVALARMAAGRNPFKNRFAVAADYPEITGTKFGEVTIQGKTYDRDALILVDGKVKKRKRDIARDTYGDAHIVGPEELEQVCKGGPEMLFVGTGQSGRLEINEEARRFLSLRAIDLVALPTPQLAAAYNKSRQRKAALIHVTC